MNLMVFIAALTSGTVFAAVAATVHYARERYLPRRSKTK